MLSSTLSKLLPILSSPCRIAGSRALSTYADPHFVSLLQRHRLPNLQVESLKTTNLVSDAGVASLKEPKLQIQYDPAMLPNLHQSLARSTPSLMPREVSRLKELHLYYTHETINATSEMPDIKQGEGAVQAFVHRYLFGILNRHLTIKNAGTFNLVPHTYWAFGGRGVSAGLADLRLVRLADGVQVASMAEVKTFVALPDIKLHQMVSDAKQGVFKTNPDARGKECYILDQLKVQFVHNQVEWGILLNYNSYVALHRVGNTIFLSDPVSRDGIATPNDLVGSPLGLVWAVTVEALHGDV